MNLLGLSDAEALHIGRQVSPHNFARSLVVAQFLSQFLTTLQTRSATQLRIAVAGGSSTEPELVALKRLNLNYSETTFGFGDVDVDLDFNSPVEPQRVRFDKFDLVLSSQVLEHVWNHQNYFGWLSILSRPSAYLWVGCPTANRPHSSPDYFSAGFTDSYLSKNLQSRGLQVIDSGMIGSRRMYHAALVEELWLTVEQHEHPVLSCANGATSFGEFTRVLRRVPSLVRLASLSSSISGNVRFAVESWVWAQMSD